MVLMSTIPGLTETAHGKEPELVKEYEDVPLELFPALDPSHHRYENRNEERNKIILQNNKNAYKRYRLIMDLRTGLFASIYVSVVPTNAIFAQQLLEACDYATRHGVVGECSEPREGCRHSAVVFPTLPMK